MNLGSFIRLILGGFSYVYTQDNRQTVAGRASYVYDKPDQQIAYQAEGQLNNVNKSVIRFLVYYKETSKVYVIISELDAFYALRNIFVFRCQTQVCLD